MARVRGYVTSRPFFGERAPQHVQNLVIRDFCARRGMTYLLSATEYAMPACYMMLEDVLAELGRIDGIVMYSIFLLPQRAARRRALYERVLAAGAGLHGAVENLSLTASSDIPAFEDIWMLRQVVSTNTPPRL
jgi:sporadic carbohydrate cluster protein (TIGR04323 family)